jgi:hypothetical protein
MHKRIWVAALVSVLMLTVPVAAQSTNASISGTVPDASGAAVAKAAITATNIRTGVALPTVTNDSGVYIFQSLLPGKYRVAAEMPGFRKAIRTLTLRVFDSGLRNQYYQNWNLSIQREITRDSVVSVRYIATKGTKLLSGVNLSSDVIGSNGFLSAFNVTRAGGAAVRSPKLVWMEKGIPYIEREQEKEKHNSVYTEETVKQ